MKAVIRTFTAAFRIFCVLIVSLFCSAAANAVQVTVDARANGMFGEADPPLVDDSLDMVAAFVFTGARTITITASGLIDLNPTNPDLQNVSPEGLGRTDRATFLGPNGYMPLEEAFADTNGPEVLPPRFSLAGALMGTFVVQATVSTPGFFAKDDDFPNGGIRSDSLFMIGSGPFEFTATEPGTLFLGINDPFASNNSGSFKVTLSLSSRSAVATLTGVHPFGGIDSNVLRIETSPFSVSTIGTAGSQTGPGDGKALSGLDFQPSTGTLFASSGFGDGGNLYTVDVEGTSPLATLVGATGFRSVAGLAFDRDGTLYGSATTDLVTDSFNDGLIKINLATGAGSLVGLYGSTGGDPAICCSDGIIRGFDALAIDPTDRTLYGTAGVCRDFFVPGPCVANIFTISKSMGAATKIGLLTGVPSVLAGLAFDSSGNLFGSLGSADGRIMSINLSNFTFRILGHGTPDPRHGSVSDIAVNGKPRPKAMPWLPLLLLDD